MSDIINSAMFFFSFLSGFLQGLLTVLKEICLRPELLFLMLFGLAASFLKRKHF